MILHALRHKDTGEYYSNGDGPQPNLHVDPDYFNKLVPGYEALYDITPYYPRMDFCYALPLHRARYEIDGYANVFIRNILVPQIDDEGSTLFTEDGEIIYKEEPHLLIELHSGSVEFGWSERTDEGYHSEVYYVEEGVNKDNQPVWIIHCHTDGCDCDGRMSDTTTMESRGGLRDLGKMVLRCGPQDHKLTEEEIESFKKEFAIEHHRSRMVSREYSHRDYEAEKAGY